ncbi:MATE family efflux transporter [uncultured Ruthenibacterium sp.]|uniref:MATE family efflux transporter n=1 Tax=uncultured Ruthenibacterium sp. TaxID=1905347 RepID=UPI00349EAC01
MKYLQRTKTRNYITNMTSGASASLILRFGLPLILANTLQQLYSMVDTIILGRFGGVTGLAVLGTCSWPTWLSVSILTNFSQASSILLAKRFGAGDGEQLRVATGNVYTSAGALCAFLMIAAQLAAKPLLIWQNTPAEILDQAVLYLRITYGGIIVLFAYNIYAAFLRALGDSQTPLYAIIAATCVNIVLDIWFVAGLEWGAPGAALATVIAQAASAIVCMLRLRTYKQLHISRRHLAPRWDVLKEYFSLSVPMLLQSFVIAAGGFFVQTAINSYGSVFAAGMSATVKVFGLLETAAIALAQSTATFVSQNYGAKEFNRVRRGVRVSVGISLVIAGILFGSMLLAGKALLSLFVTAEAIETSWGLLVVMSTGLWVMYPMYVLRQSLQALGNAVIPLVAAIIQLAARILVTTYLPLWLGRAGLYYPTVVAWITSLILIGLVFPSWLRRCEERSSQETTN